MMACWDGSAAAVLEASLPQERLLRREGCCMWLLRRGVAKRVKLRASSGLLNARTGHMHTLEALL